MHATLSDASHHLRYHPRNSLPGCDVVKEIEGLGSLRHDVVHTHRHAVDPNSVEMSRCDSDQQFRADTVGP